MSSKKVLNVKKFKIEPLECKVDETNQTIAFKFWYHFWTHLTPSLVMTLVILTIEEDFRGTVNVGPKT